MPPPVFVAFRNAGSWTGATTQINKPPGTIDGDFMIAHIPMGNQTGITPPSPAWTHIPGSPYIGGPINSAWMTKTASGEPSNYTWTLSGTTPFSRSGAISTWRGSDGIAPVVVEDQTLTIGPNGGLFNMNGVTTTSANTVLLAMLSISEGPCTTSGFSVTNPAGLFSRYELVDSGLVLPLLYNMWGAWDNDFFPAGPTGGYQFIYRCAKDTTCMFVALADGTPPPPTGEDAYLSDPGETVVGSAAPLAADAVYTNIRPETATAPSGVGYRMRGFDTTLGRQVYWLSPVIDTPGSDYTGPGPLTGIVVSDVVCG